MFVPCRATVELFAALFTFAFFIVVAAALLPIRRGIALTGLSPRCFQSLVGILVLAMCLAGQIVVGPFVIDGMFVFSWIYQVIAREFVLEAKAQLMTSNNAFTDFLKDASSLAASDFHWSRNRGLEWLVAFPWELR